MIECVPTLRVLVLNVATPEELGAMSQPMLVVPSKGVTVPVGIPAQGAAAMTVAVRVTGCPRALGLASEVSAVEDAA